MSNPISDPGLEKQRAVDLVAQRLSTRCVTALEEGWEEANPDTKGHFRRLARELLDGVHLAAPTGVEKAVEAATAAIVDEVEDHLSFNVRSYGKAWTGEREDTEFIVGESGRKALAAIQPFLTQPEGERLRQRRDIVSGLGCLFDAKAGSAPNEAIAEAYRTAAREVRVRLAPIVVMGKLQADYSLCHPEDDCAGQRAWLKACEERDELGRALDWAYDFIHALDDMPLEESEPEDFAELEAASRVLAAWQGITVDPAPSPQPQLSDKDRERLERMAAGFEERAAAARAAGDDLRADEARDAAAFLGKLASQPAGLDSTLAPVGTGTEASEQQHGEGSSSSSPPPASVESSTPAQQHGDVEEDAKPVITFSTVQIGKKPVTHLEQWPAGITLCGIDLFPDVPVGEKPGFCRGGGDSSREAACEGCARLARRFLTQREVVISGSMGAQNLRNAVQHQVPTKGQEGR